MQKIYFTHLQQYDKSHSEKSRRKRDHACAAQNYLFLHNLCKQLMNTFIRQQGRKTTETDYIQWNKTHSKQQLHIVNSNYTLTQFSKTCQILWRASLLDKNIVRTTQSLLELSKKNIKNTTVDINVHGQLRRIQTSTLS